MVVYHQEARTVNIYYSPDVYYPNKLSSGRRPPANIERSSILKVAENARALSKIFLAPSINIDKHKSYFHVLRRNG